MNRPLGRIALVGFTLALLVHVAAVAGVDVSSRFPYVWLLHFGVFLAFIPIAFSARKGFRERRLGFDEITSHLPGWAVGLAGAMFAYALFNFILCSRFTNGNAVTVGGHYLLVSHGRVLAHLTEREYHLHRAYEVRLFSGFWLTFFLIPGLYFLTWRDRSSPTEVACGKPSSLSP